MVWMLALSLIQLRNRDIDIEKTIIHLSCWGYVCDSYVIGVPQILRVTQDTWGNTKLPGVTHDPQGNTAYRGYHRITRGNIARSTWVSQDYWGNTVTTGVTLD